MATLKKTVRKMTSKKVPAKLKRPPRTLTSSYNNFKVFKGSTYTGMQVGRSHKWYYDQGEWKETKITPDLWEISYAVTKRRAGHAPEGSGVPVGTGYHWYILAHQHVTKLNANDYSTSLSGLKFKLAHKRSGKGSWSASAKAQRKKLIEFLEDQLKQLKKNPIPIEFDLDGQPYKGEAIPISVTCHDGVCDELDVTLNDEHMGILKCSRAGWKLDGNTNKKLAEAIGNEVFLWYE
jgi:hypothetical protein